MDDSLAFLNPMAAELKLQKLGVPTAQPTAQPKADVPIPLWKNPDWLEGLRWHESGPREMTDAEREAAVGDSGKAVGPYQIWPIYVQQANELRKQENARLRKEKLPELPLFNMDDRKNTKKSEEIVGTVMPWLAGRFKGKYGREPDATELAMLHNAGSLGSFGTAGNLKYRGKFLESQKSLEQARKAREEKKKQEENAKKNSK